MANNGTTGHEAEAINVAGLKAALQELKNEILDNKAEKGESYTKSQTYSKEEVNSLVSTPKQNYETVAATLQTVSVTDVLPASGEPDTIYRVSNWNGSEYDTSVYAEYAWNGSAYLLLAVKAGSGTMVHLTQAEYDALPAEAKNNGSWYFIEEE